MGSFIHHDLIAEKLEIARTMGLVTKYVVSPVGPAHRPLASVTVWPSPTATDGALRTYLARLLHGLVADQDIALTPTLAPSPPLVEADQPILAPETVQVAA